MNSAASAGEYVMWDPPLKLDSAAGGACKTRQDQCEQQLKEEWGAEFEHQLKLPAHPEDLTVQVIHVNSPSSFYVRLPESSALLKRSVIANGFYTCDCFLMPTVSARSRSDS